MIAVVIPADGEAYSTEIEDDAGRQLTQLQGLVGGYIEMVRLPGFGIETVGIVNEEGKIQQLDANYAATMLYNQNDIIAGTMVVASVNRNGELTDAPRTVLEWLQRRASVGHS